MNTIFDRKSQPYRQLTVKPHIAGKEQNKVLADDIYNQWRWYKFDEVEMRDYNVATELRQQI